MLDYLSRDQKNDAKDAASTIRKFAKAGVKTGMLDAQDELILIKQAEAVEEVVKAFEELSSLFIDFKQAYKAN